MQLIIEAFVGVEINLGWGIVNNIHILFLNNINYIVSLEKFVTLAVRDKVFSKMLNLNLFLLSLCIIHLRDEECFFRSLDKEKVELF